MPPILIGRFSDIALSFISTQTPAAKLGFHSDKPTIWVVVRAGSGFPAVGFPKAMIGPCTGGTTAYFNREAPVPGCVTARINFTTAPGSIFVHGVFVYWHVVGRLLLRLDLQAQRVKLGFTQPALD